MIIRAIFWITVVAVLMPYEAVQSRSDSIIPPGKAEFASDSIDDAGLLAELQTLALRRLQNLKEERSKLRNSEESPSP